MHIAIDIIIVAVMCATIYKAAKRGFVVSLFSLLTVVVSLIAALMFYKELGVYLNDTFVYSWIKPYVFDFVESAAMENGGQITAEVLISQLPSELSAAVDTLGIDVDKLFAGLEGIPEIFAAKLTEELASTASAVIAFAILFFAAFVVLAVICFVLDIFAKLPILKGINKIFGFALGVIEALVLGYVIAKLSVTVCSIFGAVNNQPELVSAVDKTILAKIFLTVFPW